jgi:hypothetical protein
MLWAVQLFNLVLKCKCSRCYGEEANGRILLKRDESNVFYLPETSQDWRYLLVQYFSNMVLIVSECFDR